MFFYYIISIYPYYGARYYDPKWSIFISVDPLAEQTMDAYGYCYQNPINLIDPSGMSAIDPTDYKLDKITGQVTQVGETNDKPDRILKTNNKGEIKYDKKGEAKVEIDNIEKGILKDGMNFKNNDNLIAVGGEGEATEHGVETFVLKLSEYIGKEVGGAYFSKDDNVETTHMSIGNYKNNRARETKSHGQNLRAHVSSLQEMKRYNLKGFYHTHPSVSTSSSYLDPSGQDIQASQKGRMFHPKLNYFIITQPPTKDSNVYPYKRAY